MKKLTVSLEKLESLVKETVEQMDGCGWDSWKSTIAINTDGEFFVTDCYSGYRYFTGGSHPLIDVKHWKFSEDSDFDYNDKVNTDTEWYMDNFKERFLISPSETVEFILE